MLVFAPIIFVIINLFGSSEAIVGGTQATEPVSFAVYWAGGTKDAPVVDKSCMGYIYSSLAVVTTASCTDGIKNKGAIYAGDFDLLLNTEAFDQVVEVEKFVQNADYKKGEKSDISIMCLKTALTLDAAKKTTALGDGAIDDTAIGTVAGFGVTKKDAAEYFSTSRFLNTVAVAQNDLAATDDKSCAKTYTAAGAKYNADEMLCAGTDAKGPCFGDEGAPLYKGEKIAGIFSFTQSKLCGEGSKGAVYTKLSKFKTWLSTNAATCTGAASSSVALKAFNWSGLLVFITLAKWFNRG